MYFQEVDVFVVRDGRARAVFDAAAGLAAEAVPVLVLGEAGTGRQTVARHVHATRGGGAQDWHVVDCASLTDLRGLAGHRATTIFLCDVDRLRWDLQEPLCQWLDAMAGECRVVAGGAPDLAAPREDGRLHRDLQRRLSGGTLHMPPLRSRPSDVADLACWFLGRAGRDAGDAMQFVDAVLAYLIRYDWPGNVAELEQVMQRVARRSGRGLLSAEHLPPQIRWFPGAPPAKAAVAAPRIVDFNPLAEDFQLRLIADALRRTHHP